MLEIFCFVNVYITMENHHVYIMGKSTINGYFQYFLYVNQRVQQPSQTSGATVDVTQKLAPHRHFTEDVITFVEAISVETARMSSRTPRVSESQLISATI